MMNITTTPTVENRSVSSFFSFMASYAARGRRSVSVTPKIPGSKVFNRPVSGGGLAPALGGTVQPARRLRMMTPFMKRANPMSDPK